MVIHTNKTIMLLRKFFKVSAIIFFILLLTLLGACHKNGGLTTPLIDPSLEYQHRQLTFNEFTSATVLDDTLASDETACSLNYLGNITSSNFGVLSSSFVTEFSAPASDIDIADLVKNSVSTFDSASLTLAYRNSEYYGDLLGDANKLRVQIYKINQQITATRNFYCNTKFGSIADTSLVLADTILNLTPSSDEGITFNLLPTVFNYLLNESAFALASTSLLKSRFFGLGVRVYNPNQVNGSGNICSFLLTDPITKLRLYYHDTANSQKTVPLEVNSACRRINMYQSSASTNISALSSDTSNLYIQGFGTYNGKVQVDLSKLFKDSLPVAISQAQLVFTVNELKLLSEQSKPFPNFLKVYYYDDDLVTKNLLIDELQSDKFAPSGSYNSTTKTYTVNITRTLQNYINGNTNIKGFLITCDSRNNNCKKVVIKGGKNIKLNIKYTKFK
jgi:hypothetical protein